VEDNPLVGAMATSMLSSMGYNPVVVINAASAIAELERPDPIALLLTDIILPGGMTGLQLAEEALRHRPTLKVLYTSGYTESAVAQRGGLESGTLLLSKPYRKEELRRMVRLALQQA